MLARILWLVSRRKGGVLYGAADIAKAERLLLHEQQLAVFPDVFRTLEAGRTLPVKHPLFRLRPFTDEHGLLA